MIISPHARDRMKKKGITEEEIKTCLIDGKLTIQQMVKGEIRYGKIVELKDKKLVVIYTIDKNGEDRIITCYPIKKRGLI
ncbi:MAG: DUF4258 domain-containing protein [Candidatus Aenigmarchaeota archaeon]|nr:DUF4258 domain-containing protein [Candidatus Aenigmarchaeota archaeon]